MIKTKSHQVSTTVRKDRQEPASVEDAHMYSVPRHAKMLDLKWQQRVQGDKTDLTRAMVATPHYYYKLTYFI